MNNDKFLDHYIEILTTTMTDAVIRNISMQANIKLHESVVSDLNKEIERLSVLSANQNKTIEDLTETNTQNQTNIQHIDSDYNRMKTEFENLKRQVSNAEVYRNELAKERDSHRATKDYFEKLVNELNNKIETLQAPKRKKSSMVKTNDSGELAINNQSETESSTKDGGSF